MNLLAQIMAERRADAEAAARRPPPATVPAAGRFGARRSLKARLAGARPAVIAEMKQASPSAGRFVADYDPAQRARLYAAAGAAALSVLTEPRHFLGQREHLVAARAACDLPVLRKDFIAHPYQIQESAEWGADAILLIVAGLAPAELRALYDAAESYGLEVLVEAHTAAELEQAIALPNAILGVNSRDLKTLRTDLAIARALAPRIPAGRLAVAESGIGGRNDIDDLLARGYHGFLVGELLMRGADPAAVLRALTAAVHV